MEGTPKNEKAEQELSDLDINHDSNLFDQNESRSGELYDLANGKKINNTRDESAGSQLGVISINHEGTDALPPIVEEDAAAKWLRENDPNFKK